MSKRYLTAAVAYASLALAGGVFYREYTKALGFEGQTTLSVVHTHYFMLGMVFFILLALLERAFPFGAQKGARRALALYHAGLNVTVLGLVLRGLTDVAGAALPRGLDAALSGLSGLGHIALGTGLLWLLVLARREAGKPDAAAC